MSNVIHFYREVIGLGHNNAAALVKKAINMTLDAEGVEELCTVNVTFTDDEGIAAVNGETRNNPNPTDVLSFPFNELIPGAFDPEICEVDFENESILLGDMMINIPRCEEQGNEFGHGFEREVMYLAVHSTLHLLGYDHVDEGPMKKQMRDREKFIMGDKD